MSKTIEIVSAGHACQMLGISYAPFQEWLQELRIHPAEIRDGVSYFSARDIHRIRHRVETAIRGPMGDVEVR